jgi:hypothetical protein
MVSALPTPAVCHSGIERMLLRDGIRCCAGLDAGDEMLVKYSVWDMMAIGEVH